MTRREYWEQRVGGGKLFGTSDIARLCGVTARAVRHWIDAGRLFALGSSEDARFGARVPRDALIEFLIRRTPPSDYPHHVEL